MIKLPDEELSYWRHEISKPIYPALRREVEVDVVIVGGGITGLTTAYLLKKSGLKVAVLEKDTIGSGTTGHTTGKVTSQHGLTYHDLCERLGEKTAQTYGQANQEALERIAQIIEKELIDCNWQRDDNYVYTADSSQITTFKAEVKAAAKLGLPASFETKLPLPFEIRAAVKFTGQAKMNAQKYVLGLAASVHGQGSFVFEHSRVVGIRDGSPGRVRTKKTSIIAKSIIVATNVPTFPLMARGAYCALEYPHTSYIVASRAKNGLSGMYISPDKGHYSILPVSTGKEHLLLIGGQNHIPGLGNPKARYQHLADYAEKHFGISSVAYHWKARDYLAYDDVPLVGKVYPWSKHLYTATAFRKWGLSTGMVAAMILHDLVLGRKNSWAPVFNSLRLKPIASIPHAITKSLK